MQNVFVAAVFVAMSLIGSTVAAQERRELSPAQQAEGRLMLQTARNLISLGEAKGDPLALVTAAKLMASVPGRVLADGQSSERGIAGPVTFDIDGLLSKAEDLAPGDELISRAVTDVREEADAKSRAAEAAELNAMCYWEYYCYYNSWCEYAYTCW